MFVMANDGGPSKSGDHEHYHEASTLLCQRLYLFSLLASGIAVALLKGAEFKDSKVS
jgi:ATP-dependent RNA helicase DDX60